MSFNKLFGIGLNFFRRCFCRIYAVYGFKLFSFGVVIIRKIGFKFLIFYFRERGVNDTVYVCFYRCFIFRNLFRGKFFCFINRFRFNRRDNSVYVRTRSCFDFFFCRSVIFCYLRLNCRIFDFSFYFVYNSVKLRFCERLYFFGCKFYLFLKIFVRFRLELCYKFRNFLLRCGFYFGFYLVISRGNVIFRAACEHRRGIVNRFDFGQCLLFYFCKRFCFFRNVLYYFFELSQKFCRMRFYFFYTAGKI